PVVDVPLEVERGHVDVGGIVEPGPAAKLGGIGHFTRHFRSYGSVTVRADKLRQLTIDQKSTEVERNYRRTSAWPPAKAARSRCVAVPWSPMIPCLSAASASPVVAAASSPSSIRASTPAANASPVPMRSTMPGTSTAGAQKASPRTAIRADRRWWSE